MKFPFSKSLTLGLMMNLRVTYELMVFIEWLNKRVILYAHVFSLLHSLENVLTFWKL
jgi:hypothetical protein